MRQRDRQAAGRDDGISVILPHCIPGVFGVAAGLFGIERDADDRSSVHSGLLFRRTVSTQPRISPMGIALAEARAAVARGEVPIGAVVLDASGAVLAQAGNEV